MSKHTLGHLERNISRTYRTEHQRNTWNSALRKELYHVKRMTEGPVCGYDFTIDASSIGVDNLMGFLNENCKKWCFQKERGESGYVHFQGRLNLKVKERLTGLMKKFKCVLTEGKSFHISYTSKTNSDNMFYVMKEDTRIEGPWSNNDPKPIKIPRQISMHTEKADFKLRPFQDFIVKDFIGTRKEYKGTELDTFNTRKINIIVDKKGNSGKSFLKTFCGVYGIAKTLPMINEYKDILRMVMDMPKVGGYILDMPRAIKKDKLGKIFSALETIKDGYAFDDRYEFKEEYFDCPNIWIFSNKTPDVSMLTSDRWNVYSITEKHELELWELSDIELNVLAPVVGAPVVPSSTGPSPVVMSPTIPSMTVPPPAVMSPTIPSTTVPPSVVSPLTVQPSSVSCVIPPTLNVHDWLFGLKE